MSQNKRPLEDELLWDQDVEITLRDGAKILCDIFRPITNEKIPALIAFSPYGKAGHGSPAPSALKRFEADWVRGFLMFENIPFRLGVPEEQTSGLEKFESIDPAEWSLRGYAVVNVNVRGSWESEGDLYIEGTQPGVDAYDVIEFIAALDWCNSCVSMAGNSWLATTQWTAAIQKPPSLKCIAPWEGFTDKYRDVVCRGGIPSKGFVSFIFDKTIRGRQRREDLATALERWPLMNAFWEDKALDTSVIDIPIYAVASYSSPIHGFGTVKAFNSAKSKKKWLRFHATQEWYDLYSKEATDDLQKFFDCYLKGTNNGWEETTPVRVCALTFGDRNSPGPIENIPCNEYPPKETEYRRLFLSPGGKLSPSSSANASYVSYQSDAHVGQPVEFSFTFDEATVVLGHSKARLWVSCDDNDDMDIYVSIRKVSKDGEVMEHVNVPWRSLPEGVNTSRDVPNNGALKTLGPAGILRASHREQDPKLSTHIIPFHPHTREQKIPRGTIVPVEIESTMTLLKPVSLDTAGNVSKRVTMVAMSMADGFARVTGQPQAVIVHVDVGTQALGCAVHNASVGRTPLLIFSGLSPFTVEGELKGSRTEEVLEADLDPYDIDQQYWSPIGKIALHSDAVRTIADALINAEEPLVVTGFSGRDTRAPVELVKLATTVKGLRVFDTGGSDMCFPANHPGWLGCGYGGDDSIRTADVILVLDCDVPWIPTRCKPSSNAWVIHVDVDPLKENMPVFYINAQTRYRADTYTALTQINEYIATQAEYTPRIESEIYRQRWNQLQKSHEQRLQSITSQAELTSEGYFGTAHLISQLRKAVPKDTIFAIEAVTNTQIVAEQLQVNIPGSWFNCGGGGLGWSGGAALGIKLATDYTGACRFVCQIVGDGCYLFSFPGSVYWIARRYNIPVLTIVLNNNGWNAPRNSLVLVRPDGPASRVSNQELNISFTPTPDYAGIAKAAGHGDIGVFRVSMADELPAKLVQAVEFVLGGTSAVFDAQLHGSDGKYVEGGE
ncbi:hypothetical protein CEP53_007364 [Fusarium sp. AF-6]|nr:hypothetical protein CEP53_007364 [Fusarium sp. AF-6]